MDKLRDLSNMLEKYQMIFDFSPVGICITEINGSISMNNTFCAMLGYSRNELLESEWKDITYKEDFNKHQGIFDIHSPQNNVVKKTEIRFVKKDNTIIWTEVTSQLKNDDDGKPAFLVSMIQDISQNKSIIEKLDLNEARYKDLFDNNPNPMWLYDTQTLKFLMVNSVAVAQYGYSQAEFLNMTIKDIRPPEDIPELIKNLNGIDSTIQNSGTWRHRKKDGTLFLAKISSHSIKLNGYNARVTMAIDVTEKVAAKQNLVTEAAKLKSIIESTSDTIFSVDKDYCYTSFNTAHSNMMKKVGNATIELGINFLNCLPAGQEKLIAKALIDKALKGERINEVLLIGDDERTQLRLEVLHNPVRDENGDVIGVSVFGKDITESKRALDRLEKREKEFHTLFQEAITGNYVSTPDGKIILCNPKFLDIFGFKSMEEALNTPIQVLYKSKEDRDKMKERILNEKKLENFELELIRRDGETIHVLENIVGQFNTNGELEKIIGYVIDITERKRAEAELLESKLIIEGIINTIPVRVFWKDKNLVYLGCNTIFAADAGFSNPLEIIGKDDYQMVWHDQAELYRDDDRIVIETGRSKLLIEEPQTTPEGKTITLLTSKIPLRNSKEEIIGLLGIYIDITDRKLAEEKLQESEELFRITAENLTDVIYDWDIKENIHWYGDIDSITGYPPGGFPRTIEGWAATVHPEDKDRVTAALQDHVKGVAAYAIEYRIRRRDGELRWWSARGTALRNNLGEPYKMIGSITDITERKLLVDVLHTSEAKFRSYIDYSPQGIFVVNAKGQYIDANEAALNQIGCSKEYLLQKTIADILPKEELETGLNHFNKLVKEGKSVGEFSILKTNGEKIYVILDTVKISDDQFLGFSTDITERRRVDEALVKSEKEFRILAESMPQIVWITRPDGWNIYFNHQWMDYTGMTLEESYGHGWNKPFHPGDQQRAWDAWQNATKNNGIYSIESRLRRVDGVYNWFLVRGVPMLDANGAILKWFGTCTDINEIKLAEQKLIEAKEKAEEINRIKSVFLANMSHELRTPLVGILGFADILFECLTDESEKTMAESILHSGKRLLNTLSSILSLSELEKLKEKVDLSPANVNPLCSDIIDFYKVNSDNANVELRTEFQSNSLELKINSRWLRETLNHLVKNSVNYTESGFILIKTYKRVEPISRKSFGIIEVVDTGIGIPKDKQAIIFEEFRQASEGHGRNFEGTGLGLTLAKKYVGLMNGTIGVESEEGKGTKFIISFPIDIETKTETPVNNEVGIEKLVEREILDKTNSNIKNKKILLVEDDEITRVFVKKCLSNLYNLETVKTGEQAIKVSTQNKFDLILMDINLGTDMDGINAMQTIRQIDGYEKTPVIAMTAYASENDKKEFLSKGCSHYISKPFLMKDIVGLIENIFSEKAEQLNYEDLVN